MGIVIKVENLGKKYIISHHQERYNALRDVMANVAKNAVKKVIGKAETLPKKEEFWALRNIDFEVNQGDRIGIIGRNGAGKSTLLKLLSKITEPTEGIIKIKGKIASLLEVGTGFHNELTGKENIMLNGAILGMSKKEILKKMDDIVEFSGVEKFLDTPVKRYSSGMYVRLAFAVAAHLETEILIVDEVLAVGDAEFQKKCLGKMDDISKKEGRTILFVSHNMGAVKNLCEEVFLLEEGKIILKGKTEKVLEHYMSGNKLAQTGIVDFSDFPRNSTYSPIKAIKEGWIETYDGKIAFELFMGTAFKVCFKFKASRKMYDPVFGLTIKNGFGEVVSYINSRQINKLFEAVDEGTIIFELGAVPLMPGRYHISLQLYENEESYVDILIDALTLTILPGFDGLAKHYSYGGVFYMKSADIKLMD
jgi:lipopolysaccharide transport system ATP-binding protein